MHAFSVSTFVTVSCWFRNWMVTEIDWLWIQAGRWMISVGSIFVRIWAYLRDILQEISIFKCVKIHLEWPVLIRLWILKTILICKHYLKSVQIWPQLQYKTHIFSDSTKITSLLTPYKKPYLRAIIEDPLNVSPVKQLSLKIFLLQYPIELIIDILYHLLIHFSLSSFF